MNSWCSGKTMQRCLDQVSDGQWFSELWMRSIPTGFIWPCRWICPGLLGVRTPSRMLRRVLAPSSAEDPTDMCMVGMWGVPRWTTETNWLESRVVFLFFFSAHVFGYQQDGEMETLCSAWMSSVESYPSLHGGCEGAPFVFMDQYIYIYTMNMICVFGCTHDSFGHYWCSTCIRSSLTSRHDDKRLVAQSDDANKTDVADPKEPSVGTSDNGCYRRKRFLFGSCPGSYVARDSKRRPHPWGLKATPVVWYCCRCCIAVHLLWCFSALPSKCFSTLGHSSNTSTCHTAGRVWGATWGSSWTGARIL